MREKQVIEKSQKTFKKSKKAGLGVSSEKSIIALMVEEGIHPAR
ncbi:MAG: hypothetical protein WC476_03150 [Phycisphaerae bacterium]|jgi:hypothetical protein